MKIDVGAGERAWKRLLCRVVTQKPVCLELWWGLARKCYGSEGRSFVHRFLLTANSDSLKVFRRGLLGIESRMVFEEETVAIHLED